MTTYTGKQNVEPGLYLNLKKFSVKNIEKRGALPGTEADTYRRVPLLLVLATAPLLGLVFVIFLPFIGFAAVLYLLGEKAMQLVGGAATDAVRVVKPGWAPRLAFLSRFKPAKSDKTADAAPDAWTKDVEKKLNDKDRQA